MDNNKKLLVFHTMVAPYRVDFFNRLVGHFDMFMYMDTRIDYDLLYSDIENSYQFNFHKFLSSKGLWTTAKLVFNRIKSIKPDIVMVSECGMISVLVVLYKFITRSNFSIVSIIDDSYDQLVNGRHFSKKHIFAEKVLIPRFNQVINVDNRVSEVFQKKYKKGVAFPIIRDEVLFRCQLEDAFPISENYIKQYNLAGIKVILYVGRFVQIKNVQALINAYTKLAKNDTRLVLVGTGPEEDNLKKMNTDENILFTGALSGSQLYAWYNVAHIFVLPSLVEPFGAVTNEALMAGCRCLVSERAGSSSLIKEGYNGYIFNPLDENELIYKLSMLVDEVAVTPSVQEIKPCLMNTTFNEEFNKLIVKL